LFIFVIILKISSAKIDVDSNWLTIIASFPIRNKDSLNSSSAILESSSLLNNKPLFNKIDYEVMAAAVADSTHNLSGDSYSNSERGRFEI
jgi:hypothetical protein